LQITENPYWIDVFHKLRPAYQLPSRYALSSPLLDNEYKKVNDAVACKIADAECVAVVSDGWTDINGDSIINFIITTPLPVFLKSIETKENSHSGKYIADTLLDVIEDRRIGPKKVLAVVTDNASNMQCAWHEVSKKHPHIYCYGCCAHGLNLLATDICRVGSVEKLLLRAKAIVKCVKYKHIPSSALARIQKESIKRGKAKAVKSESKQSSRTKSQALKLIMPAPTRWGTTSAMLERLIALRKSLQLVVVEEDMDRFIDTAVKNDILDNNTFWPAIQNLNNLLQPVADAIKKIETDKPALSEVIPIFSDLKTKFEEHVPKAPLLKAEEKKVLQLLEYRKRFCSNKLQNVAHLLDPNHCGNFLNEQELSESYDTIVAVANTVPGCDSAQCMVDLAAFRAKDGLWKNKAIWEAAKSVPAAVWWKGLCAGKALTSVASKVLSLPATSASAERNWSTYKHIHSSKRNRLTTKRAEKLVNVAFNLKFLDNSRETVHHNTPKQKVELSEQELSRHSHDTTDASEDEQESDLRENSDNSCSENETDIESADSSVSDSDNDLRVCDSDNNYNDEHDMDSAESSEL